MYFSRHYACLFSCPSVSCVMKRSSNCVYCVVVVICVSKQLYPFLTGSKSASYDFNFILIFVYIKCTIINFHLVTIWQNKYFYTASTKLVYRALYKLSVRCTSVCLSVCPFVRHVFVKTSHNILAESRSFD